jgi:TolB-like protein
VLTGYFFIRAESKGFKQSTTRWASEHCRDADLDPRTIGEKLFVRAVVTGEIVQRNDELLLHLELIGVDDGTQLWGAQFRGSRSDVLAAPEKLADSISSGLQMILAPGTCRRRHVRTEAA